MAACLHSVQQQLHVVVGVNFQRERMVDSIPILPLIFTSILIQFFLNLVLWLILLLCYLVVKTLANGECCRVLFKCVTVDLWKKVI